MSNVQIYAGFDVSKKFFDICVLSSDGKSTSKQMEYDKQGLSRLTEWLPSGTHCVMEATGPYYLRLACWLHQLGFTVSVVNPLVIRRFSQMRLRRAKTDKMDAKLIAAYGQMEAPPSWEPPAQYLINLQQLDAASEQLQKQCTAWRNQLEAFTAGGLMDKPMKKFLTRMITQAEKELLEIQSRIDKIIVDHHQQMLKNLTSIPGLGKKSASVLILITGGFTRFSDYKKLSAYVGLSPRIFESGSSIKGQSRICKLGMGRIRALLYVCAWSAKRCNLACRELYERLVAKGKSKKLALIAVANKLIKLAFAIAIKNIPYDENIAKNICF
jgi:transposase